MKEINLTIDGTKIKAGPEETILEAARKAGIFIPTLCSRADLPSPIGDCRLCVVEAQGAPSRFPSSCITRVCEGMVVETNTPLIKEIRRHLFIALLSALPSPRLIRPRLKKIG